MAIPKKADLRILKAFRKFRPILQQARNRDVNEADTVTLVKALLSEAFGWDPFFDVTSEFAIRSTFVDLAVKSDNRVSYLIEVKAVGGDLKDNHLRQALDYAANQGVEWVVLTNAAIWQAHRVVFGKPISHDLVFQLDLLHDELRNPKIREAAFVLTKEGMTKSAITQFHAEKQALSKFNVAAVVRSEAVLAVVRRELKRAYPNLNPNLEQIKELVLSEVLKRDVVEGEKADEAVKRMKRANRLLRAKKDAPQPPVEQPAPVLVIAQ